MLREYFRSWIADWTARISGAISVALTVWATIFPPTAQQARWALFVAALISFIVGSYHIWARERRRCEDLTRHKLIFEIDLCHTNIRVEQTNSALRVFLALQLRFENKDIHPLSMKGLYTTLHRLGIRNVRPAADIFTLFGILRITSEGIPIKKEHFEGMMVQERRLTPFYLIEAMIAIEHDEHIKSAEDLDVTDFLRVSMQSSGYQPEFVANLHPYWKQALEDGGTSQIAVTGAPSITRDYRRLDA